MQEQGNIKLHNWNNYEIAKFPYPKNILQISLEGILVLRLLWMRWGNLFWYMMQDHFTHYKTRNVPIVIKSIVTLGVGTRKTD
jgi:hypothetical protein